ncbi:hypothetical protein HZA33_01320 [Candidatus Pacearchaeota archaeon]|nr:hypothetical protein [Candidatus Pacearchaeota archaeon]
MLKHKRIREKGKLALSRYFQELKQGDKVAFIKDLSRASNFHLRMQGRTGTVLGKIKNHYLIGIKVGHKLKKAIVEASHLKKLKTSKNNQIREIKVRN